jgi:hypothetical protein
MSQRRGPIPACGVGDPGGSDRLAVASTSHRSIALALPGYFEPTFSASWFVLRALGRIQLLTRQNDVRVSLGKYCAYLSILLVTEMHDIGGRHFGDLGWSLEFVPRPMTDTRRPEWSTKLAQNIHFHCDNSRLNVSIPDNSINFVSVSSEQLFVHLREKARLITDDTERNDIVTRLDELQKAQGSPLLCVS